jgi:hypothetical protein
MKFRPPGSQKLRCCTFTICAREIDKNEQSSCGLTFSGIKIENEWPKKNDR